jgi:hypothetical protein
MSFEKTTRRKIKMNEKKKIHITINPIAGHSGDYVAYFRSEFLDATFSVFFRDTITGALALNSFAEMIRKKYEQKQVEFLLSEQEVPFQNEALLDVVNRTPSFLYGKLVSAQG